MPRKTGDLSAHGHYEEVVLADLDVAFDVETLADVVGGWGDVIVRRRAMHERFDKEEATLWHQATAALRALEHSITERHRHAVEARRLADERLEQLGMAA